jgi:phosphoglycerate dehydrogenase-like enzyme
MRVHGVRRQSQPVPGVERVFSVDRLHEALSGADHVVCILPGDTGTTGILNERALAAMKPGACVYNLGRGNAIDSSALQSALQSGHLGGAFLDVTPEEPLPSDSPLWSTPGLYLAPHASAIRSDYLDLYFDELVATLNASPEAQATADWTGGSSTQH